MKSTFLVVALCAAVPAAAQDLPTAWRAALAVDPSMASALAGRDAAAENIHIARARLQPLVNLQSTTQELDQSTQQSGFFGGRTEFQGRTQSTQLTARMGMYRPRDWIGVDVAIHQAAYGGHRLVAIQSELWSRTADAWIDVLAAQAKREHFSRALETATNLALLEEARFRAGEGTREAVAEASAQRASSRAQWAEVSLDLKAKLLSFNLLTGLSVSGIDDQKLPLKPPPLAESEVELLDRILLINPALAAAQATRSISERRLAQSGADHWPTLDLIASVNQARNDSTNTLGTRYRNYQFGVQLNVPLLAGGGVLATQRQAAATLAGASADRELLLQRLRVQFNTDWNAQAGLRERVQGTLDLVQAALEQRRAVEMGMRRGTRSLADLGTLNQMLVRREGDAVEMVAQLLKAQSRLLSLLPADDPSWEAWARGLKSSPG